ncbi:hypothetical protein MMC11_003467 [Xylographa trunciseda]|nr:hypothetical protein [Xylographa trunciseda]
MRFTTTLLLLPAALTLAQDQKPMGFFGMDFEPYFEKAKAYLPAALSSPVTTGASTIAAKNVVPLTNDNWKTILTPSPSATTASGPDKWMILISGGNKTCFGKCGDVERAWNESAAIFAADPTAPNLGYIDCESQAILCSTWLTGPAAIYYILLPVPAADQSKPATTIYTVTLNTTTVTAKEIVEIHTKKTYEQAPTYEGLFHPFDGTFAKFGINVAVGYILWAFGLLPSWTFMILISFVSRNIMNRRIGRQDAAAAQGRPVGGAPAANQ